jgi:hypothetical protein
MTVTAIQIGLDPDVCRFVFNRGAVATPDDIRRWYPNSGALAR